MIVELDGYRPKIASTAFIAPTAVLIGNVIVEDGASVWYGAVLRGDHGDQPITVGARSNVQDNCVIHVALDHPTKIGSDVTIGHGAKLEGCEIGDGAVVGMNCIVLDHAYLGKGSLLAAGSVLLPGEEVPDGHMAAGSPAQVRKKISGPARWWIENSAKYYVERAVRYREQGLGHEGT